VAFRLGQQTYALPIAQVAQIVEMVAITPVPGATDAVEGVINYHGQTVPVVDMRRRLGLPRAPTRLDAHILLARIGKGMVALVVDEVLDVRDAHVARADAVLPSGLGAAPFLRGVVHAQDGTLLVLDPERLFRPVQAKALTAVPETTQGERAR
jgi:chemotaxis signal transduction protein